MTCPECRRPWNRHASGCPYAPEAQACAACGHPLIEAECVLCALDLLDEEAARATLRIIEEIARLVELAHFQWRPDHPTAADELSGLRIEVASVRRWLCYPGGPRG